MTLRASLDHDAIIVRPVFPEGAQQTAAAQGLELELNENADLANIFNISQIQALSDNFVPFTGVAVAFIDLKGKVWLPPAGRTFARNFTVFIRRPAGIALQAILSLSAAFLTAPARFIVAGTACATSGHETLAELEQKPFGPRS